MSQGSVKLLSTLDVTAFTLQVDKIAKSMKHCNKGKTKTFSDLKPTTEKQLQKI